MHTGHCKVLGGFKKPACSHEEPLSAAVGLTHMLFAAVAGSGHPPHLHHQNVPVNVVARLRPETNRYSLRRVR